MAAMQTRAYPERWGWLAPVVTAVAFAVLAVAVTLGEQSRTPGVHMLDPIGLALLLGGSLPVAIARSWPVPAYLVAMLSIGAYQASGYPTDSPYFLGVLVTAYLAAAPGRRRRTAALALLAIPIYGLGAIVQGRPEGLYAMTVLTIPAFLAGQVVGELRAGSLRREAQAREVQQQRMLTEERLRIARELHDVISHSIATIGIQAGVAAHVLDEHPEQAREALLAIKEVSRDAMRDLRGMLGVLRQSDEADDREPAPGLARLPELMEQVRGAGVDVYLAVDGQAAPLTPATDLAAYRVVQEALTNVIRHAPGASAEVHMSYFTDTVQIEVRDDGRADPDGAATASGTGYGLSGLRERTSALGGTLEAGPMETGGFRVVACLPTSATA
jgi:signal transduction histidine kinase